MSWLRFIAYVLSPFRRAPDAGDWWHIAIATTAAIAPGVAGAVLKLQGRLGNQGLGFTIAGTVVIVSFLLLVASANLWAEREAARGDFRFALDAPTIVADTIGAEFVQGELLIPVGFQLVIHGDYPALDYKLRTVEITGVDGTPYPLRHPLNNDGSLIYHGAPARFMVRAVVQVKQWPIEFILTMDFLFRDARHRTWCAGIKRSAKIIISQTGIDGPAGTTVFVNHVWNGRPVVYDASDEPEWAISRPAVRRNP